ncbi:hypothetical protein HYS90_02235 [Candidatus Curtissbacteria bacterium]|nr:hypothetical protein [Candidatus Curtissbacteria bacterium]
MIFIVLAIIILVVSFVLALISLIREQKAISTDNESESAKSREGQEMTSDSAVSLPKAAAGDFGDQTIPPVGETGQSPQISAPQPRKPFFWEEPGVGKVDVGETTETQNTAAGDTQELWRNKPEIQVNSKGGLSGEISLRKMTQNNEK